MSVQSDEKFLAADEPGSEVTEIEEGILSEVSGGGLPGAIAALRSAVSTARNNDATSGEVVAAAKEGFKTGFHLPSKLAREAGTEIGIKHTI